MDPRAVPLAPGCLPEPGDALTRLIQEARSAAEGAWHLCAWACSGHCGRLTAAEEGPHGLSPEPWWDQQTSRALLPSVYLGPGPARIYFLVPICGAW